MRNRIYTGVLAAALAAGTAVLFAATAAPTKKARKLTPQQQRGRHLILTSGCNDCHTPKKMGPMGPEPDMSRLVEGYVGDGKLTVPTLPPGWVVASNADLTAWAGPWGISFAMNLTPDENTGIGSWSEETFIKAIRTGRHMGVSRPILPPMPWQQIRLMSDEDLKAIYAFLRTIPPLHNPVPDPIAPADHTR
jgi:mono/diheme cytochrome c family protein